MLTLLKRIFKSGWQNFKRQGNLVFATSSVLIITITLISFLFLGHKIIKFAIDEIKAKADISVYFQETAPEEEIVGLQQKLSGLSGIKGVEYVSREKALEDFVERHKDDKGLIASLEEVGANPFLASLNVSAGEMASYDNVSKFLEGDNFSAIIEKVDFNRRKPIIEKIFDITSFVDKTGIIISAVLIAISVLLVYNTTRLTIYSQKEEIGISRLVGASNRFIRGPFLIQGVLCGILSFLTSLLIVGVTSYFLGPKISAFFPEFQLLALFKNDFRNVVLLQFGCALVLGILPSFLAIRKYLRV